MGLSVPSLTSPRCSAITRPAGLTEGANHYELQHQEWTPCVREAPIPSALERRGVQWDLGHHIL